ncbi:MAG: hypothetical protein QXK89_09055 [Candidatus Bathyarchaeia archaeon]
MKVNIDMHVPARTLNLIRCMNFGSIVEDDFDKLVGLAGLNKVLLGFLRRIGYWGPLRYWEENRYRRYMTEAAMVSRALSSLDYALFKFRKPVEHVSVDVDILVRYEHLPEAVKNLAGAGFRVEVAEPYTVTMIRGGTIVDLYTQPSFAWVVYLDGERLLGETEIIEVNGVEAKALTMEAEAIATAAHAVYKEHIYLLTDYYVIKEWINSKTLKLAGELNVKEAVQISLELNKRIEEGRAEAPIKLNQAEIAKVLVKKFARDPNFRATSINIPKIIARKRSMQQLIQRIKRRSY